MGPPNRPAGQLTATTSTPCGTGTPDSQRSSSSRLGRPLKSGRSAVRSRPWPRPSQASHQAIAYRHRCSRPSYGSHVAYRLFTLALETPSPVALRTGTQWAGVSFASPRRRIAPLAVSLQCGRGSLLAVLAWYEHRADRRIVGQPGEDNPADMAVAAHGRMQFLEPVVPHMRVITSPHRASRSDAGVWSHPWLDPTTTFRPAHRVAVC